jgi:hypothetical protein
VDVATTMLGAFRCRILFTKTVSSGTEAEARESFDDVIMLKTSFVAKLNTHLIISTVPPRGGDTVV